MHTTASTRDSKSTQDDQCPPARKQDDDKGRSQRARAGLKYEPPWGLKTPGARARRNGPGPPGSLFRARLSCNCRPSPCDRVISDRGSDVSVLLPDGVRRCTLCLHLVTRLSVWLGWYPAVCSKPLLHHSCIRFYLSILKIHSCTCICICIARRPARARAQVTSDHQHHFDRAESGRAGWWALLGLQRPTSLAGRPGPARPGARE